MGSVRHIVHDGLAMSLAQSDLQMLLRIDCRSVLGVRRPQGSCNCSSPACKQSRRNLKSSSLEANAFCNSSTMFEATSRKVSALLPVCFMSFSMEHPSGNTRCFMLNMVSKASSSSSDSVLGGFPSNALAQSGDTGPPSVSHISEVLESVVAGLGAMLLACNCSSPPPPTQASSTARSPPRPCVVSKGGGSSDKSENATVAGVVGVAGGGTAMDKATWPPLGDSSDGGSKIDLLGSRKGDEVAEVKHERTVFVSLIMSVLSADLVLQSCMGEAVSAPFKLGRREDFFLLAMGDFFFCVTGELTMTGGVLSSPKTVPRPPDAALANSARSTNSVRTCTMSRSGEVSCKLERLLPCKSRGAPHAFFLGDLLGSKDDLEVLRDGRDFGGMVTPGHHATAAPPEGLIEIPTSRGPRST
mmetsp:Transcript_65488/g.188749  ORF Transcript_65488/g.188749 Transcript_65488/m.188749 type:complete len:414 (-) Transcript_65488:71-1312(-)